MTVRCFVLGHKWAIERDGCSRCSLTHFDLQRKPPVFSLGIRPYRAPGPWLYFLRWWSRPYMREGERYHFRLSRWRERPPPLTRMTEHERVMRDFLDELLNKPPR